MTAESPLVQAQPSSGPCRDGSARRLAAVVRYARRLVGTPYVPHGRRVGVGADCGALVEAYRSAGFAVTDWHGYKVLPEPHELLLAIRANAVEVPLVSAPPGSTLLLWITRVTRPQHLALLTERGTIIHCTRAETVEESLSARWRRRILSAWVPRGLSGQ